MKRWTHSFTQLLAALVAVVSATGCAVYPEDRDLTQPGRVSKSALLCGDESQKLAECSTKAPTEWYFRATTIDSPYEAAFTFVGEQGNVYKIAWEITEDTLIAYRTDESYRGGEGVEVDGRKFKGQPIAAFPISSHFDVIHSYNPSTGEEQPIIEENRDKPWYQRQFMRVNWGGNQITGYGFFMGSQLSNKLFGEAKVEPLAYSVTDPTSDEAPIVTDKYVDIVVKEVITPMQGSLPGYFQQEPVSQIAYRYSFMKAEPRDYQPLYYPDAAFEKFGFFRKENAVYDRYRGVTDFKDYLMERWNLWAKTHDTKTCKKHTDCGGKADEGITCDLSEHKEDGTGQCTIAYSKRGLKTVNYYLSPNFPAKYNGAACAVAQGWNIMLKKAMADRLNLPYTAPEIDEENCKFPTAAPPAGASFDPNKHDLFILKQNEKACDGNGYKSGDPKFNLPAGQEARWCYRAGDLRYSMIYNVSKPSMGSPLGYGPVASDPTTGEIIQGNAFIYDAAVDSYQSYIADVIDLIQGNEATELALMKGENVREYYENMSGNVFPATVPQGNMPQDLLAAKEALGQLQGKFDGLKTQMEQLKRLSPAARSPFRERMKGSAEEKMLVDNEEFRAAYGIEPGHELTESDYNNISPFRSGWKDRANRFEEFDHLMSESHHCVYRSNEYTDATVTSLVNSLISKYPNKDQLINKMMQIVWRGVTEHEMGHNMGLRHNFEASFDSANYFPDFYTKKAAIAEPAPESFGTLPLTPEQFEKFTAAKRLAREQREATGMKLSQYSSIMDYGGQFYSDFRGLGKYDRAALLFGYAGMVEKYEGAASPTANRKAVNWYLGGEACTADTDCPYTGQTCAAQGTSTIKRCSKFTEASEVPYRFCSDERAADRPFCSRFDEGSTSTEIVENLIESYDRNYVFNNFRRYRLSFGPGYGERIWSRYFSLMAKQFASLLYQLYYNPSATLSNGPGSFSDMLQAAVTSMNFYQRVLNTPDVGGYRKTDLNDGTNRKLYDLVTRDCKSSSADFQACLGTGKYLYSVWETGYFGSLERQARAGTFMDKIYAMLALTNRDWGNPQANDETYPISFYDGFQSDMLQLFSGIISGDVGNTAPVIVEKDGKKVMQYRDIWTGRFFNSRIDNNNSTPIVKYPEGASTRYDGKDLIDSGISSPFLRYYALALSLQSWQSVFNQTYSDYTQIYTFGGPEVRLPSDGEISVSYESPRRKKTYVAVQTPDKKSIMFPLVKQAFDLKSRYDQYNGTVLTAANAEAKLDEYRGAFPRLCAVVTGDTRTSVQKAEACRTEVLDRVSSQLDDKESFLNLADNLRRQMGLQ